MAAAPLMQVAVFVLVFLSATQVPMRGLSGWLHTVARFNPATNLLRMARQGFIGHVTWHDTWPGLLATLCMGLALLTFADRGLRKLTP
jgi:ABC-2 type transport system permease protein